MLAKNFDDIEFSDIQRLMEIGVPEGRSIEYKAAHYGRNDAAAKEFAADICALANAVGGDLLIGVKSVKGIPQSIEGVESDDPDELKLQIQQRIQASLEPELIGSRVKWFELDVGRGVLLIRVPRGWNGPHRVRANSQFFMRNENGKYPMSVLEVRDAFLASGRIEDQIKGLRDERAQMIKRNEHPVQTPENQPYLLFHLIPRQSLLDRVDIDPKPETVTTTALGGGPGNSFHSIDGVVFYNGNWSAESPEGASTTVFRNGVIEGVRQLDTYDKHDKKFLQINGVEMSLLRSLPEMLRVIQTAGLTFPFYACASLLNIKGLSGRYARNDSSGLFYPYRRDDLVLPPIEITEKEASDKTLRPLFDMLWNAFGQRGSPNFDDNGKWRHPN